MNAQKKRYNLNMVSVEKGQLLGGVLKGISGCGSQTHSALEVKLLQWGVLGERGQQGTTEEQLEIKQVGSLLLADQGEGKSWATSSRRTTDTVDKQLGGWGEVKVDHILKQRNIDTT